MLKDNRIYTSEIIGEVKGIESSFTRDGAIPILRRKYFCTELEAQLIFNKLWREGVIKEVRK